MTKNSTKNFNIVILGTGGQGVLTLQKIIAQSAFSEGFEIKTSELHGLSQRGGSVETHIRFGRKIFSPLVRQGGANIIISLEAQESLRACYYASKTADTTFLVNNFFIPIPGAEEPKITQISKTLRRFSKKILIIPASEICRKKLGTDVTAGIYLLALASFRKLIPLKPAVILETIKGTIPEKYLDLNLKTFELAKKL